MKQKFRFPIIRKVFLLIFSILLVSTNIVYGQNLFGVKKQLWKAQKDDVFLQEVSEKIPTETPVLSVAEYENSCFALIGTEVYLLEGNSLNKVSSAPLGVSELVNIDGNLWAMTNNGIYRLSNKNWQKIDGQIFVDLAVHHGVLHGATREEIFQLKGDEFVSIKPEGGYYSSNVTMLMEDGTQLHADPVRLGPIDKIESYSGTLYILRPGKLVLFDGKMVSTDFIDWG
ncbi:MAG: hypothetical protein HOA90_03435, partial [Prolixibacteraceae bacterium]|nr:hypothetical protein [Prolixibacteraceae bacterium]